MSGEHNTLALSLKDESPGLVPVGRCCSRAKVAYPLLSIHFSEDEIYEQDQSLLFSPFSTFLIDICFDICPTRDGSFYFNRYWRGKR
ncbi:hypothetical protein EsCd1HHP024_03391 [Escherichia sp. HH091_1A]|nr:hypothetical protein EsCd1HHP024_03391 [Escherichia sp. HH091_1A]